MESFLTWSNQQDSLAQIKHTETAGNGLFAKKDIKKDTTILIIPFHQILSASVALSHQPFADTLYELLAQEANDDDVEQQDVEEIARSKENESFVLILFLIYARYINTALDWAPYINILPTLDSFKQTHFLFKDDYTVKGTCLEQIHRTKKSNLMQAFESLGPGWTGDITFEMYQWAYCCYWSRVVDLDSDYETEEMEVTKGKVMLPMFDFANHAQTPTMRWTLTHRGVELTSLVDIDADQELLLSYGVDKPNQELIFLHGFTIKDNPVHSRIHLSILPMLNGDDSAPIEKVHCLKKMGLKPMLILSAPTDNENVLYRVGWSQDSLTAVYLVALEDHIHFGSDGDLYLLGNNNSIDTADALRMQVEQLAIYPLIQLRTIVLLLDGLEHLYSENRHYRTGQTSCFDDYRDEEALRLEEVIEEMSMERDRLMEHQVVIDFMNSM
ncbi:SET domain-containing protein [Backusella circina FSU 941]|nr:SET domain-containing protein [Backusella circina FSU 941]